MDLTRRTFLDLGSRGLVAAASAPLWLDASLLRAAQGLQGGPLLAVFFLRGGADGLHLVAPTGDRLYASSRQSLALKKTLPFVQGFGLHPEMAPLSQLVEDGELAVVHACGSPEVNRSHFEAQDRVEAGEGQTPRLRSGWLARALEGSAEANPFASIALASKLPLALHGGGSFALGEPGEFGLPGASRAARQALAQDYGDESDRDLSLAGTRALEALDEYEARLGHRINSRTRPTRRSRKKRGKNSGGQLTHQVDNLLQIEASGLPVRAVYIESTSWDTHQNQGVENGAMAQPIRDLAQALQNLSDGLRGRREWLALVHTEFGRTVRPNGSRGSDHGHASLALVAGPGVRPGLHGDWPGLASSHLTEGRDLAVTSDYRSVAWEVLRQHLGEPPPPRTFPGYQPRALGLFA